MNLSPHFTKEEFEFSQTAIRLGIDNSIPPALMENVKRTASTMEFIRSALGNRPIRVSSGYRSPKLNAAISGSAKDSAHMRALACDFTCQSFGTVYKTVDAISHILDDFDQLIYEGTWIHLGLSDGEQRQQLLTKSFKNGHVSWHKGLLDL